MNLYDAQFYAGQGPTSLASAQVVLPPLLRRLATRSVVDVGCGLGTWLAACMEQGIADVMGIDGSYVERARLQIPAEKFVAADLTADLKIERKFDLAMCMEVAEHLPPTSADRFVAGLCKLSDAVLFSASIPYQSGTGHVNENWISYWAERFQRQGYVDFDIVRPAVWDDMNVCLWYRQNAVLYVRQAAAERLLGSELRGPRIPYSAVQAEMYLKAVARGTVLSDATLQRDLDYAFAQTKRQERPNPGYGSERPLDFSGLSWRRVAKKLLLKATKAASS